MGKGEARYEQFLLFPQCFQKLYVVDASKLVFMELRVKELKETMDWCSGCSKVIKILLKMALNTIQFINQLYGHDSIQYNKSYNLSLEKAQLVLYSSKDDFWLLKDSKHCLGRLSSFYPFSTMFSKAFLMGL